LPRGRPVNVPVVRLLVGLRDRPDGTLGTVMTEIITRAAVEAMDARDPLSGCRGWFRLPPGVIYLDGNSLGALPAATAACVARVLDDWGRDLIGGWNGHDWIGWPRRAGDRISRLIGAEPGEVIVADSTSINLFKL